MHRTPPNPSPVILVIDGCKDVHRLLRARLQSELVRVVGAYDAVQGLELARAVDPSLIVLELSLPDRPGFEVLRELMEHPATVSTPVMVVSSRVSPSLTVTAFDLGATDFICKPFDVSELQARVRAALKTSSLLRMLAQRAHIDGLTGLWNRAHFDARWEEEVSKVKRHARALTLAMIDADHFKTVNDTYGHPAGDAVLHGIAETIEQIGRHTDIPFRYGGEEFAIIMPETHPDDAVGVCNRIRAAIADTEWPKHPERAVTVSIGVVGTDGSAVCHPTHWVELADRNLYKAKQAGRDRIVASTLDPERFRIAKAG